MEALKSLMLAVGPYQCCFKKHNSTHTNITKLLNSILKDNRRKKDKEAFVLVDLKKAYDSVRRDLLFDTLQQRANTAQESKLVQLMRVLGSKNRVHYGDSSFVVERGVVQGGVLSPKQFNVYLDRALHINNLLSDLIKNNLLIAFADDILLRVKDKEQLKHAIEALNGLGASFSLHLNCTKTVFLSNGSRFKGI